MKLLVVSHACSVAINQQFYANVAEHTGWDLTLLIPSNWINEYGVHVASRWPNFRGEIIERKVWLSGNIILHSYQGSMKKLLKSVNPDVIYVNHEPYAVATAQVYWANRRSINRPIGFYSCQNIAKRYPPPFRWTEQMVFRNSRFSFPITQTVDEVHRSKGYSGASTILPFGIDPEVHRPITDIAQLRAELGAGEGTVLIGFLGRVVPEKGLATLLKGVNQLREENWKLAIVGAGSYEAELKSLVQQLGLTDRVSFRSYVPHTEAPKYLSAFDITVLPSETRPNWKEQFGRVIIESLACGTPVLGSDSGEIAVLIRKTGGGRVFAEGNHAELAKELNAMIKNPNERQTQAAAGRAVVLSEFTNAALVSSFADSIRAAAGVP